MVNKHIKRVKSLSVEIEGTHKELRKLNRVLDAEFAQVGPKREEYENLVEELRKVHDFNETLAKNPSEEDIEIDDKKSTAESRVEAAKQQLNMELSSLHQLEESLADSDRKITDIRAQGAQKYSEILKDLEKFERHLAVRVETVTDGFEITFLDVRKSVFLKWDELNTMKIEGLGEDIVGEAGDSLALARMLFQCRELLK